MEYIEEKDIEKSKVKISESNIQLQKYDMYYITIPIKDGEIKKIRLFCEKGTIPDFKSDLFKTYKKNYKEELNYFFIQRLFGKNGLMLKQVRDDYIYLGGEFLQNDNYLASRHMIQENGKTGQQNFNDNLFKIKMQVEAKENQNNNQNQSTLECSGKHYIISDIHGMYGTYKNVMKKIKHNDHLYILGDVIDRGKDGIKIIQDIMMRQINRNSNSQITFLLGNHEMQFLETVLIMENCGLCEEDLINIIQRKKIKEQIEEYHLLNDDIYKEELKRCEEKFKKCDEKYQELIDNKKVNEKDLYYIGIWLTTNRGNTTIFDFLKKNRQEQKDIYEFLYNSHVVLPQQINNKDYLLVHAMPPKNPNMIQTMKETGKGYKYSELSREDYGYMLQEKKEDTYQKSKECGFTTICGHTTKDGEIVRNEEKAYIRIDAGCGYYRPNSKLALYCVEDDSVQYIDEKEEKRDFLNR